jgi:hypothetical protein
LAQERFMAHDPTGRQRRILTSLAGGDLIWEVPGEAYATQFNERTGRSGRIGPRELAELERRGWVRRHVQSPGLHRLDFWELTGAGRDSVAASLPRMGAGREMRPASRAGVRSA